MTITRRERIGLAAVAVVIAVAWWLTRPSGAPVGPGAKPPARSAAGAAAGTTPGAADVPKVAMAALTAPRPEPDDGGRDPFRFGRQRPSVDSGDGMPVRGGAPPVVRPSLPSAFQAVPSGPPPPPPIPLRFIGVVRREDGQARIAVLSDGNGVYHGREGDIIEGRYRVGRVTDDTVELTYVDGRGRQVVRLSGS